MFSIIGDNEQLYQWDRDRKISVPDGVTKVRFSNLTHGVSRDEDNIVGNEVKIPPEVLRVYGDLYIWGSDENNTNFDAHFDVKKSPKPADYVYDPEELKKWEDLQKQIGDLENLNTDAKDDLVNAINEALLSGGADPKFIAEIVEKYLEENPPESPVQSVNGKTGSIVLTSEDVKALSQDKLNEGVNEALRQAKESGEFDGKDGQNGADGKDYVITEADYVKIANIAVGLIPIYEGEVEDV
jgi:hypothetical protein